MRVSSLRWRLQVWHGAILFLAIAGFGAVLHASVKRSRLLEIDAELAAGARALEGSLRSVPREFLDGGDFPRGDRPPRDRARGDRSPAERSPGARRPPPDRRPERPRGSESPETGAFPPEGRRPPPPSPREHLERALRLPVSLVERYADVDTPPFFIVWRRSGEVLKAQPPEIVASRPSWDDAQQAAQGDPQPRQRGNIREVILAGPEATRIVVGRSIERELEAIGRLTWQLIGSGAAVFAVGLVGGWWLSGRAVQPIRAMSATAASITAANLKRRIDTARIDDELGELASILNAMLDRIEHAFEQQVRFTADASHELRTPLAIVMSHAELALGRPRSPEEYRAALEAALRSSRRMKLLVEELLTLARSDAGRLQLESAPVDLRCVAEESAALLGTLAEEHKVRLTVCAGEAPVTGDANRLSQVVTNLISNAIRYNRLGGAVTVSTVVSGSEAVLTVADTGIGIAHDDLPHLFERFYRVDRARTREHGGSGLGLAICRGIVAAHGGTISVTSQIDMGSTFTVRFPKRAPGNSGLTQSAAPSAGNA